MITRIVILAAVMVTALALWGTGPASGPVPKSEGPSATAAHSEMTAEAMRLEGKSAFTPTAAVATPRLTNFPRV